MANDESSEQYTEAEQKHLELIQGVIGRLARNSFLLKGWSVTLVAGILALTARNSSYYLVFISIFPALMFWVMDAFYLGQERHFRDMYKDAQAKKIPVLEIDPYGYESGFKGLISSAISRSVLPFHLVIVVVSIVAGVIAWLTGQQV